MSNLTDVWWVDLGAILGATLLASAVTFGPVPRWLLAPVAIPFLLLVPGYALLTALFPAGIPGRSDGGRSFLLIDLLVLAVTTSIAVAIIVGVNLGFTPFPIETEPVVGALVGFSLLATATAAFRRFRHPESGGDRRAAGTGHATSGGYVTNGGVPTGGTATIANAAVIVAVLVAVASVAIVAGTPQRGEQYTELGLLTENESGDLVATDYPSDLTAGETTSLTFTVENKEQRTVEYVVVVQLARTSADGSVVERSRLDTYRQEVAAGEKWQQPHEVSPEMTGDGLRLTYLLYRNDPPDQPTTENAYRETHIWLDVNPR